MLPLKRWLIVDPEPDTNSDANHYLDDTTWHQGPLALLAAINNLAHHLGIPNPDTAHITEQPTLFDLDDQRPKPHHRR